MGGDPRDGHKAASVPAGAVRGLPAAIGVFFMVAAALHLMVG